MSSVWRFQNEWINARLHPQPWCFDDGIALNSRKCVLPAVATTLRTTMMCRIYTHSGNTVVTKNVLVSSSPYGHWVSIIIRPCCSSYYTKSNFSRSKGLLTKIFTGTTMSVKKCTSWRLLLCNTLNRLKDLSSIS